MSDLAPTMSGANEERKPDAVEDAGDKQSETQPKSIPSLASGSVKPSEAEADSSAAAQAESKEGQKEATTTSAQNTEAVSGSAAAGADSAENTTSQDAAAATSRDRSDSLSIEQQHEDLAGVASNSAPAEGSLVCNITLLLPTGARHPYRIDEKYLAKRNVEVAGVTESGHVDPFSVSVYKLKELILREWRDEWEAKPASPSSIRLIHFGKLLEDKEQLKKYHFSAEAPNVVHMSVRPAEMMEEDEAAKGKSGGRESRSREGGGGCCVIL